MNRIITISREFGSGGREVGRRLAEAMKIAYYDQQIVTALIERDPEAEAYIRYMAAQRRFLCSRSQRPGRLACQQTTPWQKI